MCPGKTSTTEPQPSPTGLFCKQPERHKYISNKRRVGVLGEGEKEGETLT